MKQEHDPDSVIKQFDVLYAIGKGSYGKVEKVADKYDSSPKAVKTVSRPSSWGEERLKMEAMLMQHLDHPHILRIFSWAYSSSTLKILMEYCEGGELVRFVREGRSDGETLPEEWTATAIGQCFQALVYIHGKGLIHKDLKGGNILLLRNSTCSKGNPFGKRPHCVICDLGSAEVMPRGYFSCRGKRVAGTPSHMAPEVWNGDCGPKSDVWSMGCVLYEILTGLVPFRIEGRFQEAIQRKAEWMEMQEAGPRWDFSSSDASKGLCQKLLTFKESLRPNAEECLRHPWLFVVRPTLTANDKWWLLKAVTEWDKCSTASKAFFLKLATGYGSAGRFAYVFSSLDFDNSGVLEKKEILHAVTSLGMDRVSARLAASSLDIDGNNCCQYLEFAAMCLPILGPELLKQISHIYKDLDVNSNGRLEFRELLPLITELQLLIPSLSVKPRDLDRNQDGVVDFTEFCEFFLPPAVQATITKVSQQTESTCDSPSQAQAFSRASSVTSSVRPISDCQSFNIPKDLCCQLSDEDSTCESRTVRTVRSSEKLRHSLQGW